LGNAVNNEFITNYLIIVGFISALSGAYFSIKQKDLKLIMAFSTMSQVGFILVGWQTYGAKYAFSHSLFKALLFLSAGYLAHISGTRNITKEKKEVPLSLFIALWVGFLSISGLPFFAGAPFKHGIIAYNNIFGQILLNIAALGSVISVGRVIFKIKISKRLLGIKSRDISLLFLTLVCLILGIATSEGHLSFNDVFEPVLIFFLGITLYLIFRKRIKIVYPYKLFKLTNVLTIYFVIIGLLVAMTYFVS
jgi:multicomponent Na+:H+ antiporter subunit D